MKLPLFVFLCLFNLFIHQIKSENVEPELNLPSGSLKGTSVDFRGVKVYQFLGIPFAEPPLNELRFQKPVPKKPWKGVLDVNKWGAACLQPVFPDFNTQLNFSEDCLVLNVFTTEAAFQDRKNGNKLRPVMVWIHGGGFNFGSANTPDQYDGTALTSLKDVIVVSLNYRLGALGFLHLPEAGVPGNMGLWDQQLALKWVKDNIEHFGGDPNGVTIFGESAGSMSVSAQLVSPQSKGLFKNAIMQSGAIYDLNRWVVPGLSQQFLSKIGCNDDHKSCLTNYRFGQFPEADSLTFWPIAGDEFLPNHPEELVSNKGVDPNVNVLLGTVGNEGAFMMMLKDLVTFHPFNPVNLTIPHAKYILGGLLGKKLINFFSERYLSSLPADDSDAIRLAVAKAIGDTILSCPSYAFGNDLVSNGVSNVYAYVQTQKPSHAILPLSNQGWMANVASHADDIPMVFGHPFTKLDKFNNEDVILSYLMMDIWTKFAKDGLVMHNLI